MKKTLLFILLLFPVLGFSQKIISDRKEIKELKDEVEKYTKVIIEVSGLNINVLVGINSGGLWHFYDATEDKSIKFKTDIEVFNFMFKNGWVYREEITPSNPSVRSHLFEKVQ